MDRKVTIVSPYAEDEVYERIIGIDENGEDERHVLGYRDFIKENGLEYKGYQKEAGYTLAVYLISLGYIVFQGEPTDTSIIYLPETISDSQYLWWRKAKKELRRYKLAILNKTDIGIEHYEESTLCGEKPFNKLRNIIEEKELVNPEPKKVKVKKD